MINGKSVLAVVPARAGSKGLPMKNVRMLHGKPLLAWPIEAASGSRYVDRIVMSTDDETYAELGRQAGAETPFMRPAALATDHAPSIGFILHAIDTLEASGSRFDYFVLLEPTSPLTEASDVDRALEQLLTRAADADAIVGVTSMGATHPAFAVKMDSNGLLQPHSAPSFGQVLRRQDVESLHVLDGSLYISTVEALRRERSFYHLRTLGYETPRWKSFEVDDLLDFICVEAILANRGLFQPESDH